MMPSHRSQWQVARRFVGWSLVLLLSAVGRSQSPELRRSTNESEKGGFDLSRVTIPVDEIHEGGPPKDGIPAITKPAVVPASAARFVQPRDRVVGVSIGEQSRAYPISILTQHEIVNDRLGDTPIAVTYCPLCDSVVVFDRRTPLGEREFGVSGLLYNSNVLMYDRSQRNSLWSQLKSKGVSGPGADMPLRTLPMELTTWRSWSDRHPTTDVMSERTGFPRNYRKNPYAVYFRQTQLMFPVQPIDNRLPPKDLVLGIWDDVAALAVPAALFRGRSSQIERAINGKRVVIEYSAEDQTMRVISADEGLSWANAFWFAWAAFHPQTEILTQLK